MKLKWTSRIVVLSLAAIISGAAPLAGTAQDQVPQAQAPQASEAQPSQDLVPHEAVSRWMWSWLKEGKISFNARFRFEGFERDGAPFTGTAYAPTLRLALGYETPV